MTDPLTTPGTAPNRNTQTKEVFDINMAARLLWQETNVSEMNVVIPIIDAAVAAAPAAIAAGGATKWVSGTAVTQQQVDDGYANWSPTDGQTYRLTSAKTSGENTTDPAADTSGDWEKLSSGDPANVLKDMPCSGSISAGDPLILQSDGTFVPVSAEITSQTETVGTVVTVEATASNNHTPAIARIGRNSNAFALVRYSHAASEVQLTVFTTDGAVTATEGTSYDTGSTQSPGSGIRAVWVDAVQKMLIVVNADAILVTFDASNVPTFSSEVSMSGIAGGYTEHATRLHAFADGTCIYMSGSSSIAQAIAIDCTGSVPAEGDDTLILTTEDNQLIQSCYDEKHDQVLVAAKHSETLSDGTTAIHVIKGEKGQIRRTHIERDWCDSTFGGAASGLCCVDGRVVFTQEGTDPAVFHWTGTSADGRVSMNPEKVDGGLRYIAGGGGNDCALVADNDTGKIIRTYPDNASSGDGDYQIGEFDEGNQIEWTATTHIVDRANTVLFFDGDFINGCYAAPINNRQTNGSSDDQVIMIRAAGSNFSRNARFFCGFTAAGDASGGFVDVHQLGGVVTGLSGLTVGRKYYLDSDGSLSLTGKYGEWGVALSATSLLITGSKIKVAPAT